MPLLPRFFAACRKGVFLFLSSVVFFSLLSQAQSSIPGGTDMKLLNESWKFFRGAADGAQQIDFPDLSWRTVDVPHDYSMEPLEGQHTPFHPGAIGQVSTGFTHGGTGWYRKKVFLEENDSLFKHFLYFEGVYMNADVYINGKRLAKQPYGYSSFWVDFSAVARYGEQPNIVAVRVRNEGENSRWYAGSGIYRNVWYRKTSSFHVPFHGWQFETVEVNVQKRTARIRCMVQHPDTMNIAAQKSNDAYSLAVNRLDGKKIYESEKKIFHQQRDTSTFSLNDVEFWSVVQPHLYELVLTYYRNDQVADVQKQKLGIRTLQWSAENGLLLNNQSILLKGGCVHHDHGILGARSFKEAEYRKVWLLKQSGFNAVRTAHNPPSPDFLEACDQLGMLVIEEAFDTWNETKNPQDYGVSFQDWWKKDLSSMILRDYNHPSIIMWSTGNEIPRRERKEVAQLSKVISAYVKTLDAIRPVTSGVNGIAPDKDSLLSTLDIAGYNYAWKSYIPDHDRVPNRVMYGSESFPLEAWDNWKAVEKNSWVIGDFVWTALDYIGEASIGWLGFPQTQLFFPWILAYCGDIDLLGKKRAQALYRDVLWDNSVVHLVVKNPLGTFAENPKKESWSIWHWYDVWPHWNWDHLKNRGIDSLEVQIYSKAPVVEVFLNGKRKHRLVNHDSLKGILQVYLPNEPGVVEAKAFRGNKLIGNAILKTAEKADSLSISVFSVEKQQNKPVEKLLKLQKLPGSNISGSSEETDPQWATDTLYLQKGMMAWFTFQLVDHKGIPVPNDERLVTVSSSSPHLSILAMGNAQPNDTTSFLLPKRRTWQGRVQFVLDRMPSSGFFEVEVVVSGLGRFFLPLFVQADSNIHVSSSVVSSSNLPPNPLTAPTVFKEVNERTLPIGLSGGTPSLHYVRNRFFHPEEAAKPWTFWYWMKGAVSKVGITTDLEAMKQAGLGGAYLMPIQKGPHPLYNGPTVPQLSPLWWEMVRFALSEAKRLGLQLGMHVSDGFALAGGPWIKPENSMQQVVWTDTLLQVEVPKLKKRDTALLHPTRIKLAQPYTKENYYRDLAVYAVPVVETPLDKPTKIQVFADGILWQPEAPSSESIQKNTLVKKETPFLIEAKEYGYSFEPANGSLMFRAQDSLRIEVSFSKPNTLSSIRIKAPANNYQSKRCQIWVEEETGQFRFHHQLEVPQHGWQDGDRPYSYSFPSVRGKRFRFVFQAEGTPPAGESLDAAKWRPSIRLQEFTIGAFPVLSNFEGKSAAVWRASPTAEFSSIAHQNCPDTSSVLQFTPEFGDDGSIVLPLPAGRWRILRMGHTSTGHTNYTGGEGLGLECDKLNPEAVRLQFEKWFGAAYQEGGELSAEVLKIFHVDSWECGSQNWSPFLEEMFRKKNGYDVKRFLPVLAGVPLQNEALSEKVLFDLRTTIAEGVVSIFYGELKKKAAEKNCLFSAESIAPTMMSDGMLHYKMVDLPMGEFWYRSPTHDKPNDLMDALSGAHLYGKKIIQAEAFTTVRMNWQEHPAALKSVGDQHLAMGINRLAFHVFTHNPDTTMRPGITLDGVGLFFQKNQTWWPAVDGYVNYLTRAQSVLQLGQPEVDLLVFAGDDLPRRSWLPDRLYPFMPELFRPGIKELQQWRIHNADALGKIPMLEMPEGVRYTATTYQSKDWVNALNGYLYDAINPDALYAAQVETSGQLVLPSGMRYRGLVVPNNAKQSLPWIQRLQRAGFPVWHAQQDLPIRYSTIEQIVTPDVLMKTDGFAWNHRKLDQTHLYFIAHIGEKNTSLNASIRVPEDHLAFYQKASLVPALLLDPVEGKEYAVHLPWDETARRSGQFRLKLEGQLPLHQSMILVLDPALQYAPAKMDDNSTWEWDAASVWTLQFDPAMSGPREIFTVTHWKSWTDSTAEWADFALQEYAGTGSYQQTFLLKKSKLELLKNQENKGYHLQIVLPELPHTAEVFINGQRVGVIWTSPHQLNIPSSYLKEGENTLSIVVANVWANRLRADAQKPPSERFSKTSAPNRLGESLPVKSGLLAVPKWRISGKLSIFL